MTIVRGPLLRLAACAALTFAAACGSDETQATDEHVPASYTILVDGAETSPPFTLTQDQTVRVRLRFLNAAGADLDDVESDHFGGLTFDPASLATATRVAGRNYQLDVVGDTPGTGTVQVRYGHDELADETTFTPVAVTVQAAP